MWPASAQQFRVANCPAALPPHYREPSRLPAARRMSLELQEVADALSRGPVEPDRLARSMLLAMRRGSECLEDFLRALMPG
ncbi:hypothetical protein KUF71_025642 [Frankliniella fusca]|uniref:Uncharacterized protein n=1 Tax=Frankliniella fusca TaxID=407009 RepID=A0AAE1H806_9NEOP|nr:hypothetical protein KUF71_025642 [Frankliniella fusca]